VSAPGEVAGALWPVALAVAAVGVAWGRAMRLRARLNRGLHELRRPLHALALSQGRGATRDRHTSPDTLELALSALDDLDRQLNGSTAPLRPVRVPARTLAEAALERWRVPAARAGRALELRWAAGPAVVRADPTRTAQAIDNLLANAIEHGGLLITIRATLNGDRVRLSVTDSGAAGPRPSQRSRAGARGHGLAIASAIAAAHGGRLLAEPSGAGVTASLELPLAA
jgi:signal transduction histidine kinase